MYLCQKMGVLILSLFCRYCGTHRLHMLISSLSIAFTLSVLCGLCTICTCVCVCVCMCVRVCVCVLLIFLCQRMRKSIHNSVYVCMLSVCEQKHIVYTYMRYHLNDDFFYRTRWLLTVHLLCFSSSFLRIFHLFVSLSYASLFPLSLAVHYKQQKIIYKIKQIIHE